jgi:hypothetical protein
MGASGSSVGNSTGSSGFGGSACLWIWLVKELCLDRSATYFSTTGSGAFLGAGGGAANMLAQLFLTPTGIMLEAAWAVDLAVEVADSPQPTSATLEVSQLSSAGLGASHDSPVAGISPSGAGVETSAFSLRPFVCATDAPRAFPPRPRSVPRPRPPLPLSKPARPPREVLVWLVASPNEVTVASLALERDRSFFAFETSPHCEIVPARDEISNRSAHMDQRSVGSGSSALWVKAYRQLCDQP